MIASQSAIGMLELSSIAAGQVAQDAMLKASAVKLILARTICSGKYLILVGGDVAAVRASVDAGISASSGFLIEELVIPNIHEQCFPALSGAVDLSGFNAESLGVVESFSAASILEGADAAAKAADVLVFRIHVAMAVGGKGYLMLTGSVAAVTAAVEAAASAVSQRGMLVHQVVIAAPRPELFGEFI